MSISFTPNRNITKYFQNKRAKSILESTSGIKLRPRLCQIYQKPINNSANKSLKYHYLNEISQNLIINTQKNIPTKTLMKGETILINKEKEKRFSHKSEQIIKNRIDERIRTSYGNKMLSLQIKTKKILNLSPILLSEKNLRNLSKV